MECPNRLPAMRRVDLSASFILSCEHVHEFCLDSIACDHLLDNRSLVFCYANEVDELECRRIDVPCQVPSSVLACSLNWERTPHY